MTNSELFFQTFNNTGAPATDGHRARGKSTRVYKSYLTPSAPRFTVPTKADVRRVKTIAQEAGCIVNVTEIKRVGFIIEPAVGH